MQFANIPRPSQNFVKLFFFFVFFFKFEIIEKCVPWPGKKMCSCYASTHNNQKGKICLNGREKKKTIKYIEHKRGILIENWRIGKNSRKKKKEKTINEKIRFYTFAVCFKMKIIKPIDIPKYFLFTFMN